MDIFKEVIMKNLKFPTNKGELTPQQLSTLSVEDLNDLAVTYDEAYKESGKKSFLTTRSVKDQTAKLRFDVVLEILNTKLEEQDIARKKAERRENNKKIMAIIAGKKDDALKGKSLKQLEAMLEED